MAPDGASAPLFAHMNDEIACATATATESHAAHGFIAPVAKMAIANAMPSGIVSTFDM